jgi:hypothetical protein
MTKNYILKNVLAIGGFFCLLSVAHADPEASVAPQKSEAVHTKKHCSHCNKKKSAPDSGSKAGPGAASENVNSLPAPSGK